MAQSDEDLLSPERAGDILGVSGETVRRMLRQGKFDRVTRTPGGHRRIPISEVHRVRRELAEGSTPDGAASGIHT
jgi:excisionase family DNA binding protein